MLVKTENRNKTLRTASNITKEELSERLKNMEKQKKCSTCGARRERNQKMSRYSQELSEFLTNINMDQFQDSCLLCVSKHLGKAQVEYEKMTASDDSLVKGRCRIRIIGNLSEAADEASAFPELSTKIKAFERAFRYDSVFGDLTPIVDMVTTISAEEEAKEAQKQELSK